MCKKKHKKRQIIKTLTVKQEVKRSFMKRHDYIVEGGKQRSASSFSFSINKFPSFFLSKMSVDESFVEKLRRQSKERLQK
jgi:hypothetical protein